MEFNNVYIGELVHALSTYDTVPPMMEALLVEDYRKVLAKSKVTVKDFREFSLEVLALRKNGLCEESVKGWLNNSKNKLTSIFTEKCRRADCKAT